MSAIAAFIANVFAHWVSWAGGVLTVTPFLEQHNNLLRENYPKIHALVVGKGMKWMAITCLLVGCFQAWKDEHNNSTTLIEDKSKVWSQYNTCDKERGIKASLLDQLSGISSAQQQTFNRCILMLADTSKPQKLAVNAYFIGTINQRASPTLGLYGGTWIVVANRTVTPVQLLVTCTNDFNTAQADVLGTSQLTTGGWGGKFSSRSFGIGILSPAWSQMNPLIVTVYTNKANMGNCEFEEK